MMTIASFRWIKGLRTALDHIMHSIRNDERHTDVEVLGSEQIFSRTFDGWSMKLATPGPVLASWRRDMTIRTARSWKAFGSV